MQPIDVLETSSTELETYLVPYPRILFMFFGHAPTTAAKQVTLSFDDGIDGDDDFTVNCAFKCYAHDEPDDETDVEPDDDDFDNHEYDAA